VIHLFRWTNGRFARLGAVGQVSFENVNNIGVSGRGDAVRGIGAPAGDQMGR
jgi:hypothetical protein